MKTNVSIKFNSIESYREIEKKLKDLGYSRIKWLDLNNTNYVHIESSGLFSPYYHSYGKLYNSLEEFLKD